MRKVLTILTVLVVLASTSVGCWQGTTYNGTAPSAVKQQSNDPPEKHKTWDPIHNKFVEDPN